MYNKQQCAVIVGISLMTLMVFLDATIVSAALPTMQHEFNASLALLKWVPNAMFLALSALMVTVGRMGDAWGRHRVLIAGIVLFLLASLGAGCARSLESLIFFRLLQGIAGSCIPVAAALLSDHFSSERQPRVLGLFSTINGCGLALGPLLGGFLVEHMGWRWIFLINLPIGILSLLLCLFAVDKTVQPSGKKIRMPYAVALAMIVGISAWVVALAQGAQWGWLSFPILGLAVLAVFALGVFYLLNQRSATPLLDFSLFKDRYMLAAVLCCVCIGGMTGVLLFLDPFYLQSLRGESATYSGMVLLALLAAVLHGLFTPQMPLVWVVLALAAYGIAWCLANVAPTVAVVAQAGAAQSGVALGGLWTIANLSSSMVLTAGQLLVQWRGECDLSVALSQQGVTLSAPQMTHVSALFVDPSQASQVLSHWVPDAASTLQHLFAQAFMSGFSGAMFLLIGLSAAVCVGVGALLWRAPPLRLNTESAGPV